MESADKILRRLIDHSAVASLQIRTAKGVLSVEAKLLKEGLREGDRGIWLRLAGGDPTFIDKLIETSTPVLAQADDGPRRVTFVSSFLARKRGLLAGEQVLLGWPGEVKSQERRRSPREQADRAEDVRAAIMGHDSTPVKSGVHPVRVWDLSNHGICLVCGGLGAAALKTGDRLHLQLRLADREHRLVARVCRLQDVGKGQVRVGMRFECGDGDDVFREQVAAYVEELRTRRMRSSLNRAISKGR